MRVRVSVVLALAWFCAASLAFAQFKDGEPGDAKTGKSQTSKWRAGVVIKASGGACRGLNGYFPVPTEWPEQQVSTLEEDISSEVKVHYEMVDSGVRILNVRIGQIPANQEAKALVLLEIHRSAILPPENTDIYVLPEVKKLPRELRQYLLPSPKIESRDPKIRDLAKKTIEGKEKAWDKVEAIYDCVRSKVKYKNGAMKGALAALRDGTGDCEEITSLFIAMCRASEIPARTVWVPGHCYPEFYLEDDKHQGHWFPCQSAGSKQFGGIDELRPILQKGDNFRPPKNSKERQRYMAEYLTGAPMPGGGKPQVKFIREAVK